MDGSGIQVFDFPARRSYAIPGSDIDSMSLEVNGHFVKWMDMTNQSLHIYDLQQEEAFVVDAEYIDTMTLTMDDRHVIWIDSMAADRAMFGFDLLTRQTFHIGSASSTPQPPSLSQDYLIWQVYDMDNMTERVLGFDLFARQGFEIAASSSAASMFRPTVSEGYVIWQDYIDMNTVIWGVQIFKVANDTCNDAIQVSTNVPYPGDSTGATGTDISSCTFNDVSDVWHSFIPDAGGEYTVNLAGSGFDTSLALFNACNGQQLACNDDADLNSIHSSVAATMVKGKNYLIRIAGFDGQTGQYQLTVNAGICTEPILSDLDNDCKVNMADLAIMAAQWMTCKNSNPTLCSQ